VEVGDDAVLQGPDRLDRAGRPPEHALRLDADRMDLAAPSVDGDDRGLRQDDAATAHVDERVCRPEVHGHVAATEAGERVEEGHDGASSLAASGGRVAAWALTLSAWRLQQPGCMRSGTSDWPEPGTCRRRRPWRCRARYSCSRQ